MMLTCCWLSKPASSWDIKLSFCTLCTLPSQPGSQSKACLLGMEVSLWWCGGWLLHQIGTLLCEKGFRAHTKAIFLMDTFTYVRPPIMC
jgi:hypothetical protein